MKDRASELLALLRAHRTIRAFKEVPLADDLIAECVTAAQCAASSSNVQGYALVQIRQRDVREALAKSSGGQQQVVEAGAFFILCADQRRHRLMAQDAGVPFESNLESFLTISLDATLFAQNLCLAFEAQQLGTCFIGGLRNDLALLRELLQLPADVFPLFGLCVGEAAESPATKPRLALESVLFVDRYPSESLQREQIAEYDGRMASYYRSRGLAGRDWSGGVVRKFQSPKRTDLLPFFTQQGARFR